MVILIGIAAVVSTYLGGLFAIRFRDQLHLVLGFSAGAVLGVAFFDLMPEAIEISNNFYSVSQIISYVAIGFFIFMVLDRLSVMHMHGHNHNDDDCDNEIHTRGLLGATSLSFHSLLDGLAIGLAFQVSSSIGAVVAVAVLVHDFSDGINTVSVISKNGGNKIQAFKWLALDAFAPLIGVLLTLFFTVPQRYLGLILSIFAGFFLYIGASDLLPESHHAHPKFITIIATLLGAGVLYAAIAIAG